MINYIGVRGHRGAGKSSISYLLAITLDYIIKDGVNALESYEFDKLFKYHCDKLVNEPNTPYEYSSNNVYLDSFSDSIKTHIQLMLGCPTEYLYIDFYKDNIIVNFRDFSYRQKTEENIQLVTAEEMYELVDKNQDPMPIQKNIYMTLREFILYFGLEVMQRFFGRNVWVKSLRANNEWWYDMFSGHTSYKIFMDLKTPAEATYIKQNNGIIIDVIRPDYKKGKSGLDRLGKDGRIDFIVNIKEDDLYSVKDQIINISKSIIEHGRKKEN